MRSISRRTIGLTLLAMVTLLGILTCWQILSSGHIGFVRLNPAIPSPTLLTEQLFSDLTSRSFYQDLGTSLFRVLTGLFIGASLGISAGLVCGVSDVARYTLGFLVALIRPIPAIALAPLLVLLLPSSEQSIIAVVSLAGFFPAQANTAHAAATIDTTWYESLRVAGASKIQQFFHVTVPGAVPGMISGVSLSLSNTWLCLVSAEMLSGRTGMGYRIWQTFTVLDFPSMIIGMAAIGIVGGLSSMYLDYLGRSLANWRRR